MPRFLLIAILGASLACSQREAVSTDVIGPDARYASVSAQLSQFIEREMRDKGIRALSIALVDDQTTVWARGFGLADSASGRRATAGTVYRVGSVSKLFTDIGVMQLLERGEVDLDAPVQQYLPTFAPKNTSGRAITLRQLMSHFSGLVREPPRGNYFDDSGTSLADMVASLDSTALVYEPETHRKYSNAAIGAVSYLLQVKGGEPFPAWLQRHVLDSLGLEESSFEPREDLVARMARGEMWTYHHRSFDAPNFQLGMAPAGSMYSTMPDLAKFMSALFRGGQGVRGRVLRPETIESMWKPQYAAADARTGAGIGFQIGNLDGARTVNHGGAIYGFATQLSALPDEKLGVAVSASKDGMNALTSRIATEALRLMRAAKAGQTLPSIDTTSRVSLALARPLAGAWGTRAAPITVVVRDSTPLLSGASDHQMQLRQWKGDTLIADDGMSFGTRVWLDAGQLVVGDARYPRLPDERAIPAAPPAHWRGLIGEYGWDHNVLYILERGGRLHALIEWFFEYPLSEISPDVYAFPRGGLYDGEQLVFTRDASGRAQRVVAASVPFVRRTWVGEDGGIFRITPVRPVDQLRAAALAAQPPQETGEFRASDLVELTALDSTIRLDIRYATDRNFLSVPVYTQARAFLQRPAAEALVRAHRALRARGYGLLVHDGYRPWYVTRMFWDGTPEDKHTFVADPSRGSRHNRGSAVDLTMYDLRTGEPVVTTGGYDEMSDRSYPDYPGGTSRQRALREILRSAMEAEGFTVFEAEWWHFDYRDWRSYRIGNARFEELGR
ncbi:MAG: serine hydrolase [Gemmatimonadaceae bacterium]|nr:serine hydrolase [Gemmatimonadaceae bacterium]